MSLLPSACGRVGHTCRVLGCNPVSIAGVGEFTRFVPVSEGRDDGADRVVPLALSATSTERGCPAPGSVCAGSQPGFGDGWWGLIVRLVTCGARHTPASTPSP